MKTEIVYTTPCAITIHFSETCDLDSAYYRERFKTLKDAINAAEFIFYNVYPVTAKKITIWDTNTGEILAECFPDDVEDPNEEDYNDWDYNEDMGYDPYMGCYTDDC